MDTLKKNAELTAEKASNGKETPTLPFKCLPREVHVVYQSRNQPYAEVLFVATDIRHAEEFKQVHEQIGFKGLFIKNVKLK